MAQICHQFYAKLYDSRAPSPAMEADQAAMFIGLHSKFTPTIQAVLKEPMLILELTQALKEMAAQKAPGPDGVTIEFCKALWPTITEDYHAMLLHSYAKGALPTSVTEGLISLLHKGGGRTTLNNWRPITLLNVTYKIFAKALQIRLQPILMEFISPDQSSFLPMRFILDNIFLTGECTVDRTRSGISHKLLSPYPQFFIHDWLTNRHPLSFVAFKV
jgi:hypothetical protein